MIKAKNKKIVFVMMSGGVDSSVAALLLKNQGYDVVGIFMSCYNLDGCAAKDAEDARRVAEKLNIHFYIWNFEDEYKKKVVEYMIDGYRRGITPNPDVMCNREIKFGLFLKRALAMEADFVATGHYVRLAFRYISTGTGRWLAPAASHDLDSRRQNSNFVGDQAFVASETFRTKHTEKLIKVYSLFQAKDKNKDQSYFLWILTREQLKHCLFPIGDYLKSEVREIARKAGLPTAEKKDSQGICFLGKITLDEFLSRYIPEKKGVILDIAGKVIGEHKGAQFYTIGQRHLKISQRPTTNNQRPFYVAEKDIKTNTLIVAEGEDNPALYKKEVELKDVNFVNYESRINNHKLEMSVFVRVRYRQPLVSAKFIIHNSKFVIQFNAPVKFVAPGQSAALYLPAKTQRAKGSNDKMEMLGGGVII